MTHGNGRGKGLLGFIKYIVFVSPLYYSLSNCFFVFFSIGFLPLWVLVVFVVVFLVLQQMD